MPKKPKRPCSYPGYPKLTDGRFCEEHAKAEAKRYEKYDRDPAVRRRYGRAWKRIRDSYVQQHPLCEVCQKDGRLVAIEEVHHKVPLMSHSIPCPPRYRLSWQYKYISQKMQNIQRKIAMLFKCRNI